MRAIIISHAEDASRFHPDPDDLVYTFHHQDDLSWAATLPFDECLISTRVPNLPGFLDLLLALKESSRTYGGAIAVEDAFHNMYHPITAL